LPASLEVELRRVFGFVKTQEQTVVFECDRCAECARLDGVPAIAHYAIVVLGSISGMWIVSYLAFGAVAETGRHITLLGALSTFLTLLLLSSLGLGAAFQAFSQIRWRMRHHELPGASWLYLPQARIPDPARIAERQSNIRSGDYRGKLFAAWAWGLSASVLAIWNVQEAYDLHQLKSHGVKVPGKLTGASERSLMGVITSSRSLSAAFYDSDGVRRDAGGEVSVSTFSTYVHGGRWVSGTPVEVVYISGRPSIARVGPVDLERSVWLNFGPAMLTAIP
jgi:hypothetical protein